jgi:hypothetical protein
MDDFDDEGNAAELEFGKEFSQEVQFLMNDEVYILLHLLGNDTRARAGVANESVPSHSFSSFSSDEIIEHLLRLISIQVRLLQVQILRF